MYSIHSITLALWVIAIGNTICAFFWGYQTYSNRKQRKTDNQRNELLTRAQIDAQTLSNQAIKAQVELFQTQAEHSKLMLAQAKAEAGAPGDLRSLQERDKQNAESADQRQANAAKLILERKERIESEIDSLVAAEQSKETGEATGGILRSWPKPAEEAVSDLEKRD